MEELKALLAAMQIKFNESQEARVAAEKSLEGQIDAVNTKYEALEDSKDADEIKKLMDSIAVLEEDISDVRTKAANKFQPTKDEHEAVKTIVVASIGNMLKNKGATDSGLKLDLLQAAVGMINDKVKALNIGTPTDGGLAIAEVLSRDVIHYAREFSPIMSLVGRDPTMTRNFRKLVLVGFPAVATGIENIAGSVLPNTDTQKYAEIRGKTWKTYAKPILTDEILTATDINVYNELLVLLGEQMGIYQAAQILQGTGVDDSGQTNARGILSVRVDITNLTGESFKPTLDAVVANERDHDVYPVKASGVSGSFGATDVAIVDLFIDLINEHPSRFLSGASFVMNRKTKGVIEKVRDADEHPIFMSNFKEGGTPTILGYPLVIDDTMPNVAVDSTPVIFGDLSRAFYLNDGDIDKMLLDPYSVDQCVVVKTSKEMFERVGNSDAIKVIALTTNALA
jgi:HK97 family phage major capsid protein